MEQRYNTRSPAVKRLMKEAQELSEPTDQYFAQPLDDNLFEWHFTVRGPADSDFQNGIYHGRIILPVDYPMKPPSIIWLTPNGRFETNKKICLSISGHHPESWQPSWSIRTALLAIIGFMPTRPGGAIGSLDYKPEERKVLAKRSREWHCPSCGDIKSILLEPTEESSGTSQEAKDLAAQINFQGEKPKDKEEQTKTQEAPSSNDALSASTLHSPTSSAPSTNSEPSSGQPPPSQPLGSPHAVPLQVPPVPFMPWAHPQGFVPTSLSGQQQQQAAPPGVASMLPRFPFPPSHYPAGYMPPFYPPANYGMPGFYPCPYPSNLQTSTASATASHNPPSASSVSSAPTSSSTYTRSPMSAPLISTSTSPAPAASNQTAAALNYSTQTAVSKSCAKNDVMEELLHKVKRVGSDSVAEASPEGAVGGAALDGAEKPPMVSQKFQEDISGDISSEQRAKERSQGDHTDVIPHPDLDGEESSERDAPQISETDQRSCLEKSISGSTSDLERRSRREQPPKTGLRQRQSAMARMEQDPSETQQSAAGGGGAEAGQRIEAASGDTQLRGQDRLNRAAANRFALRHNYQEVLTEVRDRNSPYDFTFFLMVLLSIATVVILFNRILYHFNWEELPKDSDFA